MIILKNLILVLIVFMLVSSCATIFRGTKEPVQFISSPQNARVELSTGNFCSSTPCSITVPRKLNASVTFTKEGCEPKTAILTSTTSLTWTALALGNLGIGNILGVAIDYFTGATNDVKPNPVSVDLDCE